MTRNESSETKPPTVHYTIFHTTTLSRTAIEALSSGFSSSALALAALIFGRAVLCRNCEAIDMSQDHKPIFLPCELRHHHDPIKLALRSLKLNKFDNLTMVV
ncbi:hypothetical protein HID58_066970 [Brassica napus]|uniref:Uncharacterized protein n=1 Tax=Brassica napus TaxID=3708 RepID=A0ABQ7ZHQ5_BRANA|nr:hypothetical protein HID58_066970 [Brassica napus]